MAAVPDALINGAPVALATLGPTGTIVFANREAGRLFGADVVGRRLEDFFRADDRPRVRAFVARLTGGDSEGSIFVDGAGRRPDGSTSWLEVRARAIEGSPEAVVAVAVTDASITHATIEELRRSSFTDPLTGLANRERLSERLAAEHRAGVVGAVLYSDLDRFKLINDRLGHSGGDAILAEVGRRFLAAMPAWATVARIGGDEFAVLLPNCTLAQAERFARDLHRSLADPVSVDGRPCAVSACTGVALMDRRSPDAVLRGADMAMYEAKAAGGGQVRTYRPDSEARGNSRRDLLIRVDELQRANEELASQALTDPLTNLPNRRAFDDALAAMDAAARAGGGSYGVAYLDIDHFHDVNRTFDDTAGDAALRTIADALAGACRPGDVVYRKGGEELVALITGADLAAAFATAERFARVVRDLGITPGCDDCDVVTISGGVAALDQQRHASPSAVVAEANHAMLLAKRGGRDQIRIVPPGAVTG